MLLGGGLHVDYTVDILTFLQYINLLPTPLPEDVDVKSLFPATEATLTALHRAFLFHIPFENLNLHFKGEQKRSIPVHDPILIENKLLKEHRGGYCFELNQYFHFVLRTLGFHVEAKLARVVWTHEIDFASARTHFINLVHFTGENSSSSSDVLEGSRSFLCDVSFGGAGYLSPLLLECDEVQPQELANYRIIALDSHIYQSESKIPLAKGHFGVEVHFKSQDEIEEIRWHAMYYFNIHEIVTCADIEIGNFYVYHNPMSVFVNNIMLTKVHHCSSSGDVVKYTLLNNDFKELRYSSVEKTLTTIQRVLISQDEFEEMLKQCFGLDLPSEVKVQVPNVTW